MVGSLNSLYPLAPIMERNDPADYLPDIPDTDGHGARLLAIMEKLRIPSGRGAGKPFGEVCTPFQRKLVITIGAGNAAGILDEVFLSMAKKSGKTTFAGLLMIAWCMAFPEPNGSIILLAASRDQAALAYDVAASAVEADKFLTQHFHVRRYRHDIVHSATRTVIRAIAAEAAATVGTIPHFYMIDEVHLIGANQKGANLIRQLSSGAAAREKSIGIFTTTAPMFGVVGAAYYAQILNRSRRILAGEAEATERLMPVIFEMPESIPYSDSSQWWRANPSLGHTITLEWLQKEYDIAREDPDPAALGHFLAQHLNIQATELMGTDKWIPLPVWDKFADPSITLESLLDQCDDVWLGIDAGYRDDPSAMLVLGRLRSNPEQHLVWSRQWLHEDGYNKRKKHNEYDTYIAAGELVVSNLEGGDIAGIMELVGHIKRHARIAGVGYDPHKLKEVVEDLEEIGLTVYAIPQGWKMSSYLIATDRMLYEGKLRHPGSPMLRWNVSNGQLSERGRAMALTKPDDIGVSKFKIDGLVCLVMAIAVSLEERPVSIDGLIG